VRGKRAKSLRRLAAKSVGGDANMASVFYEKLKRSWKKQKQGGMSHVKG
jgi:hypothetical protein